MSKHIHNDHYYSNIVPEILVMQRDINENKLKFKIIKKEEKNINTFSGNMFVSIISLQKINALLDLSKINVNSILRHQIKVSEI